MSIRKNEKQNIIITKTKAEKKQVCIKFNIRIIGTKTAN